MISATPFVPEDEMPVNFHEHGNFPSRTFYPELDRVGGQSFLLTSVHETDPLGICQSVSAGPSGMKQVSRIRRQKMKQGRSFRQPGYLNQNFNHTDCLEIYSTWTASIYVTKTQLKIEDCARVNQAREGRLRQQTRSSNWSVISEPSQYHRYSHKCSQSLVHLSLPSSGQLKCELAHSEHERIAFSWNIMEPSASKQHRTTIRTWRSWCQSCIRILKRDLKPNRACKTDAKCKRADT